MPGPASAAAAARARPVVGIIGAGQLARMTLAAAAALDVDLRILAATPDEAAALVWPRVDVGRPDDPDAVRRFAERCDIVTFDHELVPPQLVADIADRAVVRPAPNALLVAQDKAIARRRMGDLGLPIPAHVVGGLEAARAAGNRLGWPLVVKAPRGGYDGRGVAVAATPDDLEAAWRAVGAPDDALVEEHVALDAEVAVLVARAPSGAMRTWPAVRTVQRDGMLVVSHVPSGLAADVEARARDLAEQIAGVIGLVGVMAVEMFVRGDEVLVNEVALRPHNAGHWTIEGSRTSQFAQHLRAVLDWPLGATGATAPAVATANVVGADPVIDPAQTLPSALAVPGASVHLYGKQPRPGRKLGHVTVVGDDPEEAAASALQAAALLSGNDSEKR